MKKFVILIIVLIVSCQSNNIAEQIKLFCSTKVELPVTSMIKLYPEEKFDDTTVIKDMTMIIYIDSATCQSCAFKSLYKWNDIINNNKNVEFKFIVDNRDVEYVNNKFIRSFLKHEILVDTGSVFLEKNPLFPTNNLLHSFMINKEHNVIYVGSPIANEKMEALFKKVIANEQKKKKGA